MSSKPPSKDTTWEHCSMIEPPNTKKVRCNYCGSPMSGGVFRMKHHLARTRDNVAPCLSAPDDVYSKFKKMMDDLNVAKVAQRRERDDPLFFNEEDVQVMGSKKKTKLGDYGVGKQQSTLNQVWKPTSREECCVKICRFIYACALPFNVVNSNHFKEMIREVSQFGNGLKPPSYHEVRHTYLKKEVENVNVMLEKYKKEWTKTGCTIMSDGWTDGKGRSITNFLVNSPSGTVFLKSLDTSDIIHDAHNLFTMLNDVVREVGEENVVQVVTDSASAYVKAGEMLMEERKHLFWTPCAAHLVDLMLADIGNLPLQKETVRKAKKVTVYIYNHTWVLSLMRVHTEGKEIAIPAVTRFATAYLTLQSILDNRQGLRSMFTSKEWEASSYSKKAEGKEVMDIVLSDKSFWAGVKYSINCASPLVRVLRLVDSDDRPSVGYIYEAMDQAKEKIAKNLKNVEKRYKEVWDIIDERWNLQLHRPLHAAAYFLNPRFHFSDNFRADEEIMNGYYDTIERMIPSRPERRLIDVQLDKFRRAEGPFGRDSSVDARTCRQPALWWQSYGCHIPELQKVAIRILSLICSATGCERNWSTFDQIHTKRRNCLEQSRMNALVFVKYNLALKDRHANRDSGTDPIVLEEMCDDDEWIVEKETPVLPNETTWLNIVDCFMEEQTNEVGESSHRRRRPRDLTKTLKGKNNAQEDDGDFIPTEDENEELDETEINLVNVLHEGPSA